MKVVIITQEDGFCIPHNIQKVIALPGIEVESIFVLDVKGSLVNRKVLFAKGFGLLQTAKMAVVLGWNKALDFLDLVSSGRICKVSRSIRGVARENQIACHVVENINAPALTQTLERLKPDVILSFSAPCVFKQELLNIPAKGCINLHCSALPKYAGLLPSFWVLYHKEKVTGATVHYMDDRIDNGGILGQVPVAIDDGMSMFEIIACTKSAGGDLVCEVIEKLRDGKRIQVLENHSEKGSYFTWPTIHEMREFRRKGGRLI